MKKPAWPAFKIDFSTNHNARKRAANRVDHLWKRIGRKLTLAEEEVEKAVALIRKEE